MNEHRATEQAFKNGYKKAAEEIFAEIDSLFVRFYDDPSYSSGELGYDIAKLKRKYKEGET